MASRQREGKWAGTRRVAAFALACVLCSGAALGAVGYRNPFLPEQCGLALAKAQRLLQADRTDRRGLEMRAEALLCRGLQNDPAALDTAIAQFEEVTAREPLNFYSRLYLAEAVRHKFPYSDEAIEAFLAAQRVLEQTDVGAARARLEGYIGEALDELHQQHEHFAALIRAREAALDAGTASSHEIGRLLQLVALTGPHALSAALSSLDAYVGMRHDRVLDTFYRAELLRDRLPESALTSLYESATVYVCHGDALPDHQACFLAHKRLTDLDKREAEAARGTAAHRGEGELAGTRKGVNP